MSLFRGAACKTHYTLSAHRMYGLPETLSELPPTAARGVRGGATEVEGVIIIYRE
jgi:hypothetical protein